MSDVPQVRASDADREDAVTRLRAACVEGRLDLEEFTERLDLAYRAVTRDELVILTRDLREPIQPPGPGRRWFVSLFGGSTVKGRWTVGPHMTVVDIFGGTTLHMGSALVTSDEVRITVFAMFGGADVIVPEGADVHMTGGAIFGGNDFNVRSRPVPGSPRIIVRAFTLFGGTDVKDRPRRSLREVLGLGRGSETSG